MKMVRTTVWAALVVTLLGGATQADWDPGEAAKWVQLADVTSTGVDVKATSPKVLADDFLCSEPGPITGIHIWGSWLDDELPGIDPDAAGDPNLITFHLGIHADIPADQSPFGYSMPGSQLWGGSFNAEDFNVQMVGEVAEGGGWFDPNTGEYIHPAGHDIWQYNILIDPAEAFYQLGSPEEPIVYWLGVLAETPDRELYQFGWRTSSEHWNDDAVWTDFDQQPDQWKELRYPSGHAYSGQSIDLAFVITPAALPGDVNGDGWVSGDDLTIIIGYWGQTGLGRDYGDLNGNGTVDGPDYTEVLSYWGTGSPPPPPEPIGAPEPATLGLLVMGGLALLRRRREG